MRKDSNQNLNCNKCLDDIGFETEFGFETKSGISKKNPSKE